MKGLKKHEKAYPCNLMTRSTIRLNLTPGQILQGIEILEHIGASTDGLSYSKCFQELVDLLLSKAARDLKIEQHLPAEALFRLSERQPKTRELSVCFTDLERKATIVSEEIPTSKKKEIEELLEEIDDPSVIADLMKELEK